MGLDVSGGNAADLVRGCVLRAEPEPIEHEARVPVQSLDRWRDRLAEIEDESESLALGGSQGSSAMPAADPAPVLVLFCRVVEGPMDALARSVGVIEGQDRLGADDLPHVACVAVDDLDARPAGPGQPAVLRAAIATHGPLDHEHPARPPGSTDTVSQIENCPCGCFGAVGRSEISAWWQWAVSRQPLAQRKRIMEVERLERRGPLPKARLTRCTSR